MTDCSLGVADGAGASCCLTNVGGSVAFGDTSSDARAAFCRHSSAK